MSAARIFSFSLLLACLTELVSALIRQHDVNGSLLQSYDYIICGCGISGLVTARRLSEDPSVNVLCIEAGPADQYEAEVLFPVFVGNDVGGPYDWNLSTVAQSQLDGSPRPLPQGRVLGGGSILNGMVWHRAGSDDYDAWNELGATGWAWADMLPYFMKSENYTPVANQSVANMYSIQFNTSVHGYDGPVQVSYPEYIYPQSMNFFHALNSLEIPTAFDPNDGSSVGAAFTPQDLNHQNQTRADARISYYDPVATRQNLHVILNQHVTRLIFDEVSDPNPQPPASGGGSGTGPNSSNSGLGFQPNPSQSDHTTSRKRRQQDEGLRVVGVEYATNDPSPRQIVYATREVIVAAGALHTAQILQLSGVGPSALLRQYNISVAVDLPGVGSNLQDHCLVGTFYPYNNASFPLPSDLLTNSTLNIRAAQDYEANKTGPYTAGAVDALAFLSLPSITNQSGSIMSNAASMNWTSYLPPNMTDPTLIAGYQLQRESLLARLGTYTTPAIEIINNNAGALTVALMHPFSRGTCSINSADPFIPPSIDPRWLTDPTDRAIITAALLFNRVLLATPPMQLLQPAQFVPAANATFNELQETIDNGVQTEFHVSGTAAMLPLELGGVVDPHCRVYGTSNLRVVDASVFPMVPGGHIQAVVYAVAEKAAAIIEADNACVPPVPVPTSLQRMTALPTPTVGAVLAVENWKVSSENRPAAGEQDGQIGEAPQAAIEVSVPVSALSASTPASSPTDIPAIASLRVGLPGWSLNEKQMQVFLEDWAERTWGACQPWNCTVGGNNTQRVPRVRRG